MTTHNPRIASLAATEPRERNRDWRRLAVGMVIAGAWLAFSGQALQAGGDEAPASRRPPNLVLLLADDLGWADLGCYGNRFHETPQLDRLAQEGVRFTQFYAGPVCSPTRANLQSGQDQARFGITQHIPGHRRPFAKLIDPIVAPHLPLEVETFAERLQAAGYATGYFGKWHLGGAGFGPGQQGWRSVIEHQGNTAPPALTGAEAPQRAAEFLTGKALEFIDKNRDQPFLLQVSYSAVHIPLSTTPELLAKYQQKKSQAGHPSNPAYAGLLEELDASVGRIVAAIERAGIANQTLILFLSDNGGLEHQQDGEVVTSNQPLRGEKGQLFEGGIRIPAIAFWPGKAPAGAVCAAPAITMDIYPTLLEIAGVKADGRQPQDGVSLAPLLLDPSRALPRSVLFWHLPHYHHSTPASAVRQGDWKLIEFFETGEQRLFNLLNDPGELTDLSATKPSQVAALQALLTEWRGRVGAQMPKPNPNFDERRAHELENRNSKKKRKS